MLAFASTFILFNSLWSIIRSSLRGWNAFNELQYHVPSITAGFVFMVIGLYMMKSGVKRKEE